MEVHQQCSEEHADVGVEVESFGNLLLAHTEALCMSRVGGSESNPVLVPRDLRRPLKNSTWKIHNTLTSRSEHSRKCRSAGVLPREECIFNSTSLDYLSTQETRLKAHWIITDEVVVN